MAQIPAQTDPIQDNPLAQQAAGLTGAMQNQMNETEPTEHEQALYDVIVTDIEKILYNKKTMPRVLKMLSSKQDPTDAIAFLLLPLADRIKEGLDNEGIEVPSPVWRAAAEELIEVTAELGMQHGALPEMTQEQLVQTLAKLTMAWTSKYPADPQAVNRSMQQLPPEIVQSAMQGAGQALAGQQMPPGAMGPAQGAPGMTQPQAGPMQAGVGQVPTGGM